MPLAPIEASRITRDVCALAPVMPVLVIDDVRHATPLAETLVAGGLPALEVTLRTPAALEAIREMTSVEGGVVGAGTLVTPSDVRAAKAAGAQFGVSPGATPELIQACTEEDLPLLPGAATASEAMALLSLGFDMLKFFPAAASGGVAALNALGAPLPKIGFCPTGGITAESAPDYLACKNVFCVGGSWVAPTALLRDARWDEIRARAETASRLRPA